MPFNGSGVFNLIYNWQQDALNNINISSSRMMGQENDIAAGLSLCITKDGQQTPTANLPMGGFRLTNMGNATAQGNAVSVQDVQNNSVTTLTTVSGTDTITANTAPSIGSYATGQRFQFIPAGANTTTAVTLNINGLGAKNVLKPTQAGLIALATGDIVATVEQTVIYDGTQFQLQTTTGRGRLINTQSFTSSGTYTPTPGTAFAIIEGIGAGGGGGGASPTGGAQVSVGNGGNAGAKGRVQYNNPTAQTVTIGAAGTAGSSAGGTGGNGGNSSVGAIAVFPGGAGGPGGAATGSPTVNATSGTAQTVSGSGTILEPGITPFGWYGYSLSTGLVIGGRGADPANGWGVGVPGGSNNGSGFGAGGTGGNQGVAAPGIAGGTGAPGKIIIYEYA